MAEFIPCTLRDLPPHQQAEANKVAKDINPANAPSDKLLGVLAMIGDLLDSLGHPHKEIADIQRIGFTTTKLWSSKGVDLGVGFMDSTNTTLNNKILAYANKWGQYGNVKLRLASVSTAEIRIMLGEQSGYWSYLGVDCASIPRGQQTMNLQGFSMATPDSEFDRVVCHEFGHGALGAPHEHMRAEIIKRLDRAKTIAYFERTQGWSQSEVVAQVLTPISEASLLSPTPVDVNSIMTYQLPGSITIDGNPIPGGVGIDAIDGAYCGKIYPLAVNPPPPPPPPGSFSLASVMLALDAGAGSIISRNHVTGARAADFRKFEELLKAELTKAFPGKDIAEIVGMLV